MRCPKCHYLSFDSGERCRNCGYEFSLAVVPSKDLDLPVAPEPEGPLAELALGDRGAGEADRSPAAAEEPGLPADRRVPAETGTPDDLAAELPLFREERETDRSRGAPRLTPRPPLAVRRAPPVVSRGSGPGPTPAEFRLDLEPPSAEAPAEREPGPAAREEPIPARQSAAAQPLDAGPGGRLLAALLDAAILAALDAAIVHLTLQVAALAWTEIALLPWIPLVAFLMLVDGAYAVAFTGSSGQTPGKMAAGIRVVRADGASPPGFRRAVGRAAACVISLAPAGLGLLPVLIGADRRALHDRLARTRVVKVS